MGSSLREQVREFLTANLWPRLEAVGKNTIAEHGQVIFATDDTKDIHRGEVRTGLLRRATEHAGRRVQPDFAQ